MWKLASLPLIGVLFCVAALSCTPKSEKKPTVLTQQKATPISGVRIVNPEQLTPNSSLQLSIALNGDSVRLDSVVVSFYSKKLIASSQLNFSVDVSSLPVGKQLLSTQLYLSNDSQEKHIVPITLFAPSAPQQYQYRKTATYTHDPDAYTQGLVFHEGALYESTGTRGESTLRKIDIESGKVLKQISLDDKYFGEGLTIWSSQLVQLTWTSNVAFAYDMESLEQIKTFHYPTEGWGLATLGDELVMSDGSEKLYFLDPSSFAEKRSIQVYDEKEKVLYLNELEVIDGLIYANVYQTDKIVMIDPESGAVVGVVSLEGVFNKQGYNRRLDVLNGIAWDESGKRLFVTGKWWPKLYQIELYKIQL